MALESNATVDYSNDRQGYVVRLLPNAKALPGHCTDCYHMIGRVSWWCENPKAVEAHNTAIPKQTACKFWTEAEREP